MDWRYLDRDPRDDQLVRRDTPVSIEEMAVRLLEEPNLADAIERCREALKEASSEEEAGYWRDVQQILASRKEGEWSLPYSAGEMALDLLAGEGFDEAIAMCRSEIRRLSDPLKIVYFKRVETLLKAYSSDLFDAEAEYQLLV
jgi:hypothetical protein